MSDFCPTTLFKGIREASGRHVCIHADYLTQTTKVVKTIEDYHLAKSLGWCDEPHEALARLEAEDTKTAEAACERAYDDRNLSEPARAELEAVEEATMQHVLDPVIPKRGRGRPRKDGA